MRVAKYLHWKMHRRCWMWAWLWICPGLHGVWALTSVSRGAAASRTSCRRWMMLLADDSRPAEGLTSQVVFLTHPNSYSRPFLHVVIRSFMSNNLVNEVGVILVETRRDLEGWIKDRRVLRFFVIAPSVVVPCFNRNKEAQISPTLRLHFKVGF